MKAIILAAGRGTRLKKYTRDLPKGMLPFAGKTIIERQIGMYRKHGFTKIIVVRGFAAEKINYSGVTYYTNSRYADTNMVESLMAAEEEFNEDVIVSYSDIVFEEKLLEGMMEIPDPAAAAVDDNWKEYWRMRYGRVDYDTESLSIDEHDHIVELGREGVDPERIDARYIGLLKFSREGLQTVVRIMEEAYRNHEGQAWQQSGKTVRQAYMTDLLNALIQSGTDVRAVHFHNGWLEFDTNEDYEQAIEAYQDGRLKKMIVL